MEEGDLTVDFDGREVIYGFGELDELVLAYATTIHKSQNCSAVSRTSIQDQGAARMIEDYYDSNGF